MRSTNGLTSFSPEYLVPSFCSWELTATVLRTWCDGGKKKGKRFATRELRLFFVCAQDWRLAKCGPDGQGYKVGRFIGYPENITVIGRTEKPFIVHDDAAY
eukprot:g16693.t1